MKKLIVVIGFVAVALALILAASQFFNIAYVPAIVALLLGFFGLYLSKQKNTSKKSIQLIFLLTGIALILATYKTIFVRSEGEALKEIKPDQTSDSINKKADIEINKFKKAPQLQGMEEQ